MATKTACPVMRSKFRADAQPIEVKIGNIVMSAIPKEFSTGSLGWYANGKIVCDVGGTKVEVQVGLNLTVVGSKELPLT